MSDPLRTLRTLLELRRAEEKTAAEALALALGELARRQELERASEALLERARGALREALGGQAGGLRSVQQAREAAQWVLGLRELRAAREAEREHARAQVEAQQREVQGTTTRMSECRAGREAVEKRAELLERERATRAEAALEEEAAERVAATGSTQGAKR